MPTNAYMFLVAGLIPLAVGFFYYNTSVMGKPWMKANGFSEKDLAGANMGLIFGLSYLFSVMIAFMLSSIVIHQGGAFGMMAPEIFDAGSAAQQHFNELMQQYGDNSRDFKHGALHGSFLTIFFVFPLIAINALFERRGWIYILIHTGYWLICLTLMGGLICQTLEYAPL